MFGKNLKKISQISIALFGIQLGLAQSTFKTWEFGIYAGKTEYYGKLGSNFLSIDQGNFFHGGFSVGTPLTNSLDLTLFGSFGNYGILDGKNSGRLKARNLYTDLTARYYFQIFDQNTWVPFIFGGLGVRSLSAPSSSYTVKSGINTLIPVGIGLDYRFHEMFSLRYFSSLGFNDYLFNNLSQKSNGHQLLHNIGLVYKIGRSQDSDQDGILDAQDKCPNTPKKAPVNQEGCPVDSDGDGISNHLDKCPSEFGTAEQKGCPEISQQTKQLFEKAMSGIQFEIGKDIITPSSNEILEDLVKTIQASPQWIIEIQGHTDNTGDANLNKSLSQSRAEAVKKYFESKGIQNTLKAVGYGSNVPMSDNESEEGRAKNRRVEFKITYEE